MLYWTIKSVLTPLLRVLYRVQVEGRERIPRHGAVILAANHRSFLDSIFIPLVVPRRVTFVAKDEYFNQAKTRWFFEAVGQIPINRAGGDASASALTAASEILARGEVFAIYPEGTRTRDGLMHRGHTGVARLAYESGAPIVPVGLIGTDEIQPVDSKIPRVMRRVTIRFGEPIDARARCSGPDDRLGLRAVTDEVMFELATLTGYQYVDTYTTRNTDAMVTPITSARSINELNGHHDAPEATADAADVFPDAARPSA